MTFAKSLGAFGFAAIATFSLLAAAHAQQPQRDTERHGGDLSVTMDLDVASLDPLHGSAIGYDRTVLNLFYENLFIIDPQGNMVPRLASDWQMSEDGLSLTVNLQPDVWFHDGLPFNAEAVKANIDRLVAERNTSRMTTLGAIIAGAEVVDDDTVLIHFERASGTALSILASETGMMVSPAAMSDPEILRRNPVGTGPFLLAELRSGFRTIAKANPDYWRTSEDGYALPYIDTVTVRVISDTAVALAEAFAGTAHIIDRIQVRDFARVQANPDLYLNPNPTDVGQFLVFNNSGAPFGDNPTLRQAIQAAIDPAMIEMAITGGAGKINPTWVPPSSWEYTEDLPAVEYDPERARQLYAESGHIGPIQLSIIQRDPDTQIAQLVQAQLAQIGIPLEIEVLEREAWVAKASARQHEMAMLRSTAPLTDPDMRFSGYYLPESGGNYSAITDEELIAQVRAAEAETVFEKRKEIYADIQRRLIENAYEVYLFGRPAPEVIRAEVSGFATELVGSWLLDEVWLSN